MKQMQNSRSKRGIKVLYVCPWAHWAGHPPQAATNESPALLNTGTEVSLCTFRGILGGEGPSGISHRTVASTWIGYPLSIFTRLLHSLPRGKTLAWFLEQVATLCLSIRLRKSLKYDVIYLRDGDPFIFVPFVLGLVSRNQRWAISIIGTKAIRDTDSLYYRFINAPFWKPVYRRVLSRNRFAFLCENNDVKDLFEKEFLDGILSRNIRVVPRGVMKATGHLILQKEARRHLDLPADKAVFLHFGNLHPGKDIETVLAAIRDVPGSLLLHAGNIEPEINLKRAVGLWGCASRTISHDYYIDEAEKPYYFAGADAIILSYKKDFIQGASMLLEAARYKLPVIASDVGNLGKLVRQYEVGSVFHAEDAATLGDALLDCMSYSQGKRETIASNCERLRDDFSLENWAQRCAEIFTELCE